MKCSELDLNPRPTGFDPFAFFRNCPSEPRPYTECINWPASFLCENEASEAN